MTKSNSNELPISVPLSSFLLKEETIEKWEKRINREIKGYWNACENNSLSFDTKK